MPSEALWEYFIRKEVFASCFVCIGVKHVQLQAEGVEPTVEEK